MTGAATVNAEVEGVGTASGGVSTDVDVGGASAEVDAALAAPTVVVGVALVVMMGVVIDGVVIDVVDTRTTVVGVASVVVEDMGLTAIAAVVGVARLVTGVASGAAEDTRTCDKEEAGGGTSSILVRMDCDMGALN